MVKQVVIVGAGPSGLLLAHYLLSRKEQYHIDIYERRNDLRLADFSIARTFPLVLNKRGLKALSNIEGVVEAVKAMSVESTGTLIHGKNGRTHFLPRGENIFILDRNQLVTTLLQTLTEKCDADRLSIHFNHQCREVDFEAKTVTFGNTVANTTVDYNLLIGADGARSRVREQFLSTDLFELEQKYIPFAYKSIHLPASYIPSLQPGYIHTWKGDNNVTVTLVPLLDGAIDGTVGFLRENNPITHLSTTEKVLQFFQGQFPEIARLLPESEAQAFSNRPSSDILTIRCDRYHHSDSVLLIGDAAHATSPSLGQGCNASFEDVLILDQLLDEFSDNVGEAIAQFSLRRKPDGHALVELSDYAFPLSGKLLFLEFLFRLRFAKFLHRLFPERFLPSLFQLVSETTVPYSEILDFYKDWISKVKQANEKSLKRRSASYTR